MAEKGRRIDGRYEVLDEIAQGGMGVIYRVAHELSGREEALKLIHRELASDKKYRDRFLVEVRAVAKLTSDHTIRLYDCGATDEDGLYLTMELLEGNSLSELIRREGAFEYRRALRLACQICRSLEEAHGKGIVHRDLKPSNLFVTVGEDGAERLKVLDFGIARIDSADGAPGLTAEGTVLGTPTYMSPEQIQGKPLDHRTDLYSLGVVLYEMLTGRPPFLAADSTTTWRKHLSKSPPSFRDVNPGTLVPLGLEDVIMRCLQKAPDQRPATATELRRALEPLLSRRSGTTDPVTPVESSAAFDDTASSGAPAPTPSERPEQAAGTRRKEPYAASDAAVRIDPEAVPDPAEITPPPASIFERFRSARLVALAPYALLLLLAAELSITIPRLAPARWLDQKARQLKQGLFLGAGEGHALVVRMDPEHDRKAFKASGEPVPGQDGVETWRRMDARILSRLADAGAAVVVFDKYYDREFPEETRVLARAITEATERGTHVVVGALDRPPPSTLVDAGAWVGSLRAIQSGFDDSVGQLHTRFPLIDGTKVPALFLRAHCLLREAPAGAKDRREEVARCEDEILSESPEWQLRYGREPIPSLRLPDVLSWSLEDLREEVLGKAVFVGHFGEGVDEVVTSPVPSLEPTSSGMVHGVMLLATAFNQLDRNVRWVDLGAVPTVFVFLLLGALPFLLLRKQRWPRAWVAALVTVTLAAAVGLALPVDYPWGAALAVGVVTASLLMIPAFMIRRRGAALVAALEDGLRRTGEGVAVLSSDTARRLGTPVADEAGGLLYLRSLNEALSGPAAGGRILRALDPTFLQTEGAVPAVAARLHRGLLGDAPAPKDLEIARAILRGYTGREQQLSAAHWRTLQVRLSGAALAYARQAAVRLRDRGAVAGEDSR